MSMIVRLQFVYAGLQCRRKIVDPNPTHGIGGAGFPDHQNRVFGYDIGGKPLQHLLRRLARYPPIDDRDRRGRIPPGEDLLQTMRIGEIRGARRQPGRRRPTDRDDLDGLLRAQPLGQMRQLVVDLHQLVGHIAGERAAEGR